MRIPTSIPLAPLALAVVWLGVQARTALAQGTAFTYQGQLRSSGFVANGTYNLTFSLYNASTGGDPVAGPVMNNGVAIRSGLFMVTIDFGASAWSAQTNWLEIAVETNGAGSFTALSPRQQLTPVPYAISAASISGVIQNSSLPTNLAVAGTVTANGYTGNGAGLTNLPAGNVVAGVTLTNPGVVVTQSPVTMTWTNPAPGDTGDQPGTNRDMTIYVNLNTTNNWEQRYYDANGGNCLLWYQTTHGGAGDPEYTIDCSGSICLKPGLGGPTLNDRAVQIGGVANDDRQWLYFAIDHGANPISPYGYSVPEVFEGQYWSWSNTAANTIDFGIQYFLTSENGDGLLQFLPNFSEVVNSTNGWTQGFVQPTNNNPAFQIRGGGANTNLGADVLGTFGVTNIQSATIGNGTIYANNKWQFLGSVTVADGPTSSGMLTNGFTMNGVIGVTQSLTIQTNSTGPHGYILSFAGGIVTNIVNY